MKFAALRFIETTFLPAVVLTLWQSAWSKGWLPRLFLPAPSEIWISLTRMVQSGELLLAVGVTGWRLLVGWLAASLLGIALGIAVGSSRIGHRLLSPTLEFIRPLPASALIPLLILAMGLTDQMIVAVIALGSLWPVMLGTVAGTRAVEPRLLEVAAGHIGRVAPGINSRSRSLRRGGDDHHEWRTRRSDTAGQPQLSRRRPFRWNLRHWRNRASARSMHRCHRASVPTMATSLTERLQRRMRIQTNGYAFKRR